MSKSISMWKWKNRWWYVSTINRTINVLESVVPFSRNNNINSNFMAFRAAPRHSSNKLGSAYGLHLNSNFFTGVRMPLITRCIVSQAGDAP